MKKLFFLFASAAFFSCSQSTFNKLKNTVERGYKRDGNFEHFEIDSFRYSLGSMLDYYSFRIAQNYSFINEDKESLKSARELSMYSAIVGLSHKIKDFAKENSFLTHLLDHIPQEPQIYTIDYHIDYQTDKSNFKGHETLYLYAKDLSPVYLNIDSLYKIGQGAMPEKYDSSFEINFLKMNDSLTAERNNLSRQLELKIAGGTTQLNILHWERVIAQIDLDILNNKAKYIYLYEY